MANFSVNPTPSYTSTFEQHQEFYIMPIIISCILVLGIIGNGTIVLTFWRNPQMRTATNTHILSIALADLVLLLINGPTAMTQHMVDNWQFGLVGCKICEMVKDFSMAISIFTLIALSYERFCLISKPNHSKVSSKLLNMLIVITIWLVSFILTLPAGYFSYLKEDLTGDQNSTTIIEICYPIPEELGHAYGAYVVATKFAVYYVIPVGVIIRFYMLMGNQLWGNSPGMLRGNYQSYTRKWVAKVVLTFVIIFQICFLPHHTFMLWFHWNQNSQQDFNNFWHHLKEITTTIILAHSCLKPIVLYFMSTAFKQYFNQYLFKHFLSNDPSQLNTINRTQQLPLERRVNPAIKHQVVFAEMMMAHGHNLLEDPSSSEENLNDMAIV